MEKITNIEINNFKSIRHAEIKDCRRINLFIGYPNVGKSNILEALGLYSFNDGLSLSDLIRVKEEPTLFFNGDIQNSFSTLLNNSIVIEGSYIDNTLLLNYKTHELDRGLKKEGSIPAAYKQYKLLNYKLVESILSGNPNERSRGIIVENYFSIKKYDFRKGQKKSNGKYSSLNYPFGDNIFSIIASNKKLFKDVTSLFEIYATELLYDSRQLEYTILRRTETGIFSVPYELIADTLQRLIFYKAAVFSNKDSILLFEEPEAHMFPPYIRKMTSDIVMDKNNNQYFIATHSPYVLDELMAEAADDLSIYLVDYKDGETKIIHLSNNEFNEIREYGVDLFFNIESYLKHGQVNNA